VVPRVVGETHDRF